MCILCTCLFTNFSNPVLILLYFMHINYFVQLWFINICMIKGMTTPNAWIHIILHPFVYSHTHQAKKKKFHTIYFHTLFNTSWTFSNMHILAALSGCRVVTSDRTHTVIRCTVSLHSEHVYNDNIWVKTSIKMNYCAIFRMIQTRTHSLHTNSIYLTSEISIV